MSIILSQDFRRQAEVATNSNQTSKPLDTSNFIKTEKLLTESMKKYSSKPNITHSNYCLSHKQGKWTQGKCVKNRRMHDKHCPR